jgi:cytidylate kinase
MQIICVSRGALSRGKELAESLADKLGYTVVSRETLTEEAIDAGIQVSKLETSMLKPQRFTERLARERDHYLAFSTAYLCERALEGPLVYHGRTGHLLLRGIGHVLRVRVVADEEDRIAATMRELGVDHEKARRYLEDVEEDRRNWARAMYGSSGEEPADYDVVVNVERMSVHNAAASLLGMCQLPEFQMTPASRRELEDLRLSARARLLLARDPRTSRFSFTASAHHGKLTVTYLPHDLEVAPHIEPVLEPLEGVDLAVTMASTTILWVQESFDPEVEAFRNVAEIAQKWNAAVELVQYVATEEESPAPAHAGAIAAPVVPEAVGGIEEDVEEEPVDEGLEATLNELARLGLSGGARYVHGQRGSLISTCCSGVPHSLVVIGDLFLGKNPAAQTRLRREVQESIASQLRVPVVTSDELRTEYFFGPRDAGRAIGYLLVVILLYLLVFTNQLPVLEFLAAGGDFISRALVAVAVFAFIPVVAWSYGTVARSLMKLIKME